MDIIKKYFPEITEQQQEKFSRLNELYIDWNAKINVVSRKDIEELPTRHILHSLGIAKVIQFPAHAHDCDHCAYRAVCRVSDRRVEEAAGGGGPLEPA